MPTINQLIRQKKRLPKYKKNKAPALLNNPQKMGTCLAVFTKTPRKPNSALRKVAKVRLVNLKTITVFIPGEGHDINRFSDVMIEGRHIRDLPGVKYGAIRGKLDLGGVLKKKNARSKFGTKKPTKKANSLVKPSLKQPGHIKIFQKKKVSKFLKKDIRHLFNPQFKKINTSEMNEKVKDLLKYSLYLEICKQNKGITFTDASSLKRIHKRKEVKRPKKGSSDSYELLEVSQVSRFVRARNLKDNKVYVYKL